MKAWLFAAALVSGALAFMALCILPQPSLSQTHDRINESAAFEKVASVLLSPRCQNCHTLTSFPRQGDDRHPHLFNVARGDADKGAPGLPCSTCHGRSNNAASGVPGTDEEWRLAPRSMGWENLSTADLCRQLKDPQHNGQRSGNQIIDHLRSQIVRWAWSPGADRNGKPRTAPPIPYADFIEAAEVWMETGAVCP
jgi:hypothetical protein